MNIIDIRLEGLERVFEQIEGVAEADFRTAFDRAGIQFRALISEGIENEVDPFGIPWPPFSPNTERFQEDPSAKLLQDTGALVQSIGHEARRSTLNVFANIEYASDHNDGLPDENLPQRQFIPGEELPAQWLDILEFEIGLVLEEAFQ